MYEKLNMTDTAGNSCQWDLRFHHSLFFPATEQGVSYNPHERRVGIVLEASRPRESSRLRETELIATASFPVNVTSRPARLDFVSVPGKGEFVQALVEQGYATCSKEADLQLSRNIDLYGFYDRYVARVKETMRNDEVSHIRLGWGQPINGRPAEEYITCRIGGIEQSYEWVGTTGKRIQDVVDVCPDTRFQFYELVKDTHAKHIALYHEAQKRVTDFKAYTHLGDYHIRCKIDGVHQFSKTVGRLDMCDYKRDHNIAALCAKYYGNELDAGQKLNCNRSR